MSTSYSTTPLIGVGLELKSTTQEHDLGTVVEVNSTKANLKGKFAMYVQASAVIGNSNYVTIALSSISCLASSVDGGSGTAFCRNGSVAFAANEYGWVYILKPGNVLASNS